MYSLLPATVLTTATVSSENCVERGVFAPLSQFVAIQGVTTLIHPILKVLSFHPRPVGCEIQWGLGKKIVQLTTFTVPVSGKVGSCFTYTIPGLVDPNPDAAQYFIGFNRDIENIDFSVILELTGLCIKHDKVLQHSGMVL